MIKEIFKNPITLWLKWFLVSRKLLIINRKKHLKIGYMTNLKNVSLGLYNTFYDNVTIDNSKLGDFVYVANNTKILNTKIGNFCSIGPNVKIGLGMHPTSFISTFPAFFSTKNQCQICFTDRDCFEELGSNRVGNDVWIGANAIVMDNINIGDGAIIAAGAVVTKDVAPYSIVGGVPAKIIKYRFNVDKIESLLNLKWWEKDLNWIKRNIKIFQNPIN